MQPNDHGRPHPEPSEPAQPSDVPVRPPHAPGVRAHPVPAPLDEPDAAEPDAAEPDPAQPVPVPSSRERAIRRRRIVRRVLLAMVAAALWCGSAYLYSISSGTEINEPPPVDDGVFVSVEPLAVNPAANSMQVRLSFVPVGSFASGSGFDLARPVQMQLFFTTGIANTVRFDAGEPMRPVETEIYLDGEWARYPFDNYVSSWGLAMSAPASGGRPAREVPVGLSQGFLSAAWRLSVNAESATDDGATSVGFSYEIWRSTVTVVFALLLLGLMVVLGVLGVVVASKVASRRARVEATMASWFGAMIFALLPLRTFLPGAPPVGAWIDILVLFWVMLGLVAALAVFVWTWWVTAPPGPPPGERRSS